MKFLFTVLFAFIAFASCGQIPNTLSPAEKVYGLSKIWQEVNYNFVYFNRVDKKAWDSTYLSMITKVQQTKNDYDYYKDLQRFAAFLKDGHTDVVMPESINNILCEREFGKYWFMQDYIDGKVIITHIKRSMKDEVPVGSEILEVNGMSIGVYMRSKIEPYISSSTDYILKRDAASDLFEGFEGETFQIKIRKPDGNINTLELKHDTCDVSDMYPPEKNHKLLNLKWYDRNIVYLALNSFEYPKIDTLFLNTLPELYKAKGLIIDLRNNGGGNSDVGMNILKYLTYDTLLFGSSDCTRLNNSAYKAWGEYIKPADTLHNIENRDCYLNFHDDYYYHFHFYPDTIRLKAKRIVIPTVILTGNFTASAAEDFLVYADRFKNIIRIGEKTYGSTGQPYFFKLPGGGGARVCTKKDTYPDGREFVGYGVKPDIEVKPTVQDFIDNKDPVMDKALEYLKTKIK